MHMAPKTTPKYGLSVRISAAHHEPSRGQPASAHQQRRKTSEPNNYQRLALQPCMKRIGTPPWLVKAGACALTPVRVSLDDAPPQPAHAASPQKDLAICR